MQVSGAFPFVGGSLNEDPLIDCSSLSDRSVKKFRYFVVDSSVILAMLEQPPGPDQGKSCVTDLELDRDRNTDSSTLVPNTFKYPTYTLYLNC